MAIAQGMTTSFKQELMEGVHNFTSDTFKIALYTSNATLGAATTSYSGTNEVSGSGYTAGGENLTVVGGTVDISGTTAFINFANVSWTSATIAARGALIYNSTAAGNPAVAVLDFGSDKICNGTTFTVHFPTVGATAAIIRIA